MRSAQVVIGANFGDEGKGAITDYLSSERSLVVRFNGGAQAAHTAVTPDRLRHVFHHLGAGSLRGASTYLSEFFVFNPVIFNEERAALLGSCNVDVVGKIFVSPSCPVTTPHDVMLNMMTEEHRGEARHGSCALGVHETTVRSADPWFQLWFNDISHLGENADHWWKLQQDWTRFRLNALNLTPSEVWQRRLSSKEIFDRFLLEWQDAHRAVTVAKTPPDHYLDNLIFEGAQGLLLDQDHRFFPHVTHSHTGLTNVDLLATRWGIEHLTVTYVTRSYATRHGKGPLPRETPGTRYFDDTNVTNLWQGDLRFGELDLDLLKESIENDLRHCSLPLTHHLAMTHLDQCGDQSWGETVASSAGAHDLYLSRGPTRDDVTKS